jgi:hypothetical protein
MADYLVCFLEPDGRVRGMLNIISKMTRRLSSARPSSNMSMW